MKLITYIFIFISASIVFTFLDGVGILWLKIIYVILFTYALIYIESKD